MIHALIYGIYRAGGVIAQFLPIESVFRAGEILGTCAYWLLFRRRRLAIKNLQRALGDQRTPAEIRGLAREHFRLLGANLFSCLKLGTMSSEEVRRCVTIETGLTVPPEPERRGWVAMISHLGNWELASHLAQFFPEYRFGAVYHPLANGRINRHMASQRERAGVTLFDRRHGYLRCVKFLREGGALGVLTDQSAGAAGVWAPLFGRLASTSQLAATLAIRAGADIVPIGIHTVGCARWKVATLPPLRTSGGGDSAELTARMNQALETLIAPRPADWLWSHDRWKTPRPRFLLAQEWRRFADSPDSLQPFRILIRAPDDRTEAEASVPAIRAIKQGRPDAWVAIAAASSLADVFTEFDEFIGVPPHETLSGVARRIRAAAAFDAAIILPNSWRAALEVRMAGVPCRAGHPARLFLNYWKMPPWETAPPETGPDRYLRIAAVLGAVTDR